MRDYLANVFAKDIKPKSVFKPISIDEDLEDKIETKNLGHNENADNDFIESIVNILLDATTILAKILHII